MPKTSKASASTRTQIPGVFESYMQGKPGVRMADGSQVVTEAGEAHVI